MRETSEDKADIVRAGDAMLVYCTYTGYLSGRMDRSIGHEAVSAWDMCSDSGGGDVCP